MSAAAAMRRTQLHGEPKLTLVGPAHARDGDRASSQDEAPAGDHQANCVRA
jgi:hypothetical protein